MMSKKWGVSPIWNKKKIIESGDPIAIGLRVEKTIEWGMESD